MPAPTAIVRGSGPRDGFPDYVVRWLRADRFGVFSGLCERHWRVGPTNQRIDLAWLSRANAPAPWGIPCVDAQANIADAVCTVTYRYEGAEQDDESPEAITYELDTSMAEKPIQTHPSFGDLKVDYLWDDAERKFAEFLPKDDGSSDWRSTAFSGAKASKTGKNPLFGIETYFSVSAIYRITFATKNPPADLLKGIGTIIKSPPNIGQFRLPAAARKRNWLKMAPKIQKRGNTSQITKEYALGHVGGWRTQIYSAGQLEEEGPGE